MNPDQSSREQIEPRLTALLLGELPADEAALLRYTIAHDPALQKLHDELQSALALVREAEKTPAEAPVDKNAPLKLSVERREKLLAHFKTPRAPAPAAPLFWLKRINIPSLIPALAAVVVIAVVAAALAPVLFQTRSRGQYESNSSERAPARTDLMDRTWSGDKEPPHDQKVTTASLETNAFLAMGNAEAATGPRIVTVPPEPTLAPPPLALPGTQIVLPSTESGQLADNVGTEARIALPPGNHVNGVLARNIDGLPPADNGKTVRAEKQWKVPSLAGENAGALGGSFASGGAGGAGGGGAIDRNAPAPSLPAGGTLSFETLSPSPMPSAPATDATDSMSLNESGANRATATVQPGQPFLTQGSFNPIRGRDTGNKESNHRGRYEGFFVPSSDGGTTPMVAEKKAPAQAAVPAEDNLPLSMPTGELQKPVIPPPVPAAPVTTFTFNDQPSSSAPLAMPSGQFPAAHVPVNPTPTMDAVQLQIINQQRIDLQKSYQEQLVQLQELKSITNKERLRNILPQVTQDATLNDLLAKQHEAVQKMTAITNAFAVNNTSVVREQSSVDELTRQIDDHTLGLMAGLESHVNSQKAALESMATTVAEHRQKEEEEAAKNQPYYDAQRELQQKLKLHELLYSKLEAEKLDLNLPKTSMVQITDRAEPGRSQNLWQRLTGQVESKARVKVENDVTDIQGMAATPQYASYDPYFVQATLEVMQSDAVLSNVVHALNLQSAWGQKNGEKLTEHEAISQLRRRLDLHPVPNTKLVEIGVTSEDPHEAAKLANAVANAYGQYRSLTRQQLTTAGLAALQDQFAEQEKDLKLAQAKVEQLAQEQVPKPAPEAIDVPLRKPAPNAPVPQPEILTRSNAFSTFSLNVSDVSFKFAEASLQNGKLPDTASIRSEEFVNAFDYRDPEAAAGQPMAFASERARYPFAHNRELLRFAIKTAAAGRPAGRALNLVLLLDNSGSMERADRVAIIREALRVLATQLQSQDTVSVVTFARTARLWADGVSGDQAAATLDQVGSITPEGGTNLEEAMRLAYETARRHYLPTGLNRVVLLTDGAANLGNVDPGALKEKVETQRKQGIALDCFGIGWEDYNDDLLEQLSSNGDGRYAFLNSPEDAATEFAAKLAGALQIAAADVKVQVEFNPARVISYRQIGYAKHQLTKEQFRDNTVDAAEIAAQEAGNALYTIETNPGGDGPVATVHVRYRIPGTADYREHSWAVAYDGNAPALDQSSPAMRLAATAAAFSEWLAASPYAQEVTLDELLRDLSGVPEIYGADDRPKQLEIMIREAKSLEGK